MCIIRSVQKVLSSSIVHGRLQIPVKVLNSSCHRLLWKIWDLLQCFSKAPQYHHTVTEVSVV